VAGYVIARVMAQQRQQRQVLAAANRRLSHYAATLEQLAITQERNRMARELHDTLAHTLSGLAVQLEAVHSLWPLDPDQAHTLLEGSLQATRDGLAETRQAIQSLRAGPLEDLGLLLALRSLAELATGRAGAALHLDLPPTLEKLAPDVEQCIYRVAQEALENIVQHAGAAHITVGLGHQGNRLVLAVADDGQGFDARPSGTARSPDTAGAVDAGQRFGLQGMRERAGMAGGSLDVTSQPGQGTTVRLTLEPER
jgi:signal transduction histidine kinase